MNINISLPVYKQLYNLQSDKSKTNTQTVNSGAISFSGKKRAIYKIDAEGNYKRYESQAEAAREANIFNQNISYAVIGRSKSAFGYLYVYADEIENKDKNGNITVDKEKLNKIMERYQEAKVHKPVYAIKQDGSYKKYINLTTAAKETGISFHRVSNNLAGKYNYLSPYTFIYADKAEQKDKDGNISVNEKIIKEELIKLKKGKPHKAVYTIDRNGKCKKYPTQTEAAQALGIKKQNINQVLTGKARTAAGHAIIYANELEDIDENGEITLNNQKITNLINSIF